MKNIKIIMSYDGTRYKGWEHQPGVNNTIQGKLESVLEKMTGSPVEIIGAGRTDAGVHARAMTANFHIETEMSAEEIRDYMNKYLPDDICIIEAREASDRFHARYNAVGKTYRYSCYIGKTKPVFNRKYVCDLNRIIDWMGNDIRSIVPDMEAMKKASEYLCGSHDYASFCSNPKMKKSTVRVVDRIDITREGEYLHFTYHGTGFLQHMVRILTGTLLEVGYRKRSPESIPGLIEAKDRKLAGFTAPPDGLCLMEVEY